MTKVRRRLWKEPEAETPEPEQEALAVVRIMPERVRTVRERIRSLRMKPYL